MKARMSSGAYRTAAPTQIHGTPRFSHRHRRRVFTERQRRSAAWYSSSSRSLHKSEIGWGLVFADVIVLRDPLALDHDGLRPFEPPVCQKFVLILLVIRRSLPGIQWDLPGIQAVRPIHERDRARLLQRRGLSSRAAVPTAERPGLGGAEEWRCGPAHDRLPPLRGLRSGCRAGAIGRRDAFVRNFFQPSFKLAMKERDGAQVRKCYHPSATPCQRPIGGHTDGRGGTTPAENVGSSSSAAGDPCGPAAARCDRGSAHPR